MRNVAVGMVAIALLSITAGCAATDPPANEAGDVTDLTADSFPGTYAAASPQDDNFFGSVKVTQRGDRLSLDLDGETHPLSKTPSGAFVFTHGEGVIVNPCDNPGCGDIVKISGVVFLKKVGNKKQAQIKLTVTQLFSHPESEGDLEGEVTDTVRWVKAP